MDIATALQLVRDELDYAMEQYPPFASPHEGIAIIEEEFIELRDEVFQRVISPERMLKEAIQTAAMSVRFMIDLNKSDMRQFKR